MPPKDHNYASFSQFPYESSDRILQDTTYRHAMHLFTIALILAFFRLASADNVTRAKETPAFYLPLWVNASLQPTEVTVGIDFGDLSGSAITTLIDSSVSTPPRVKNPFTFFSNTTTYAGPYTTTNLISCATHAIHNTTTASAGFVKPTNNINLTAGSLGRPIEMPTPTNLSLLSSGAVLKKGSRLMFLFAVVTLSYLV
jgi:hypothetical protein